MNPTLRNKLVGAIVGGSGAITIAAVMLGNADGLEGRRYYPYQDVVGVWTVCYGHTGSDIRRGHRYTDKECDALLQLLVNCNQEVDMEEIIVTFIGSNLPALPATKFYDEEDDVEYIAIKGDDISQAIFRNISQGTAVELYSQTKSLGFYTLITATADMVLLAKGDIPNLLKRKSHSSSQIPENFISCLVSPRYTARFSDLLVIR